MYESKRKEYFSMLGVEVIFDHIAQLKNSLNWHIHEVRRESVKWLISAAPLLLVPQLSF